MLPRAALAALSALLLLPVGCGGDDPPPQGPPRERFGPAAVAGTVAVERIRARLAPVSDLVGIGRQAQALGQLAAAREGWHELRPGVAEANPVLAREVSVAFERVERAIRGPGTFDAVRDVASPLGAQLLGGVEDELVRRRAQLDPGVDAAALVRLLDGLADAYSERDRPARVHAFGLVQRSQALAREIAGDLGPRRPAVVDALRELRADAFPEGVAPASDPLPAAEVRRRAAGIQAALRERFELAA